MLILHDVARARLTWSREAQLAGRRAGAFYLIGAMRPAAASMAASSTGATALLPLMLVADNHMVMTWSKQWPARRRWLGRLSIGACSCTLRHTAKPSPLTGDGSFIAD